MKKNTGPQEPNRDTQSQLIFASSRSSRIGAWRPGPGTSTKDRDRANIEVIDLSSSRDHVDHARNGPRGFQKLNELHKSIVRVPPAHILDSRIWKPSIVNAQRPQLSFLSTEDVRTSARKTSTDYGGSDLDDLPSPSAFLIGKHEEVDGTSPERGEQISSSFNPDELQQSVNDNIERQNEDATACIANSGNNQYGDLENEEDYFDDLPDPTGEDDDMMDLLPSKKPDLSNLSNQPVKNRLFLSTDSPRKSTPDRSLTIENTSQKRGSDFEDCGLHPPKKAHFSSQETRAPLNEPVDSQNLRTDATTKNRFQPWDDMTGIDMDVLAEYADYVEFV